MESRLLVESDVISMSACLSPLNGDESEHIGYGCCKDRKVRRLAADKGYDADALRNFFKNERIQPQISS